MGNMSYCRFVNTLMDLEDCLDALKEGKRLSEEEYENYKNLVVVCREIVDDYGEYNNPPDPDDEDDKEGD